MAIMNLEVKPMIKSITSKKLLIALVPILVVLVIGLGTGLVIRANADTNDDFPSFVMIYEIQGPVSSVGQGAPKSTVETHRLEYSSKDKWIDTVIEAEPVVTSVGTFSRVGSYEQVENGVVTKFDATFNDTQKHNLEDNTRRIPSQVFAPYQIQGLEAAGEDSTQVTTASTVCVREQCAENATGLKYVVNGKERIYAANTNGIPLKIGDRFIVNRLEINR
ncbi:MAG: hypothetical protein IIB15_02215 [Chloroflexi bacterium]|nr:hypothetical protein [Chloroflexota bacterium]